MMLSQIILLKSDPEAAWLLYRDGLDGPRPNQPDMAVGSVPRDILDLSLSLTAETTILATLLGSWT